MPSRLIKSELDLLANRNDLENRGDNTVKTLAILAGLKLSFQQYTGDSMQEIAGKLAQLSDAERSSIAKKIHPVICAMKLQLQTLAQGSARYLAENAHPCGSAGAMVLLSVDGTELTAAQAAA